MSIQHVFSKLASKLERSEEDFNTMVFNLSELHELDYEVHKNVDNIAKKLHTLIMTCYRYSNTK